MRTNHAGVTEVAHIRTNKKNFDEGWERIFGKKSPEGESEAKEEQKEENSPQRENDESK